MAGGTQRSGVLPVYIRVHGLSKLMQPFRPDRSSKRDKNMRFRPECGDIRFQKRRAYVAANPAQIARQPPKQFTGFFRSGDFEKSRIHLRLRR